MAAPLVKDYTCDLKALEEIISKYWKKSIDIKKAKAEPAAVKGSNFVSDAWQVHFEYGEKGKKDTILDSVFIKTVLQNKEINELMHTSIAFQNEIHAYERVIPTMNKYLRSPIRAPAYVFGNESSVVLEDMNKRSFHSINKKLAVEWNQIWSPIQEMAKLHAASLVLEKLDKAKFDELVKGICRVSAKDSTPLGERQATVIDTITRVLEEDKSVESIKYKDVIKTLKNGLWKEQENIITKDVPIRVINHGSIWINNLLYRGSIVTLLDWQHLVYSTPAFDLSYFLYVNLNTDFLNNKRRQLLDCYISSLHHYVYDSAVDRMPAADLEALLSTLTYKWIDNELKRCSLYAYMMAQWITPVFYWSEATYDKIKDKGGFEAMTVDERLQYITYEGRDRIIKLTKFYMQESMQG